MMRVYHHPRDLLCAHSACGCPEQPSPAFTFMFGRCQNRNLPTGYKGTRSLAKTSKSRVADSRVSDMAAQQLHLGAIDPEIRLVIYVLGVIHVGALVRSCVLH